ncbi:MAG TPA: ABC transporter substrate-binding protein [Geminicoccus sp.]|jgi:glucose/mannose transport system substrate-binding protein|uniref:ABC transporter substrate-binding protein n=1 Tax=Geminicoccus sp. TaxID=2024832 RepID=UPI002E363369|nr:ABC transporter substrate-binding protein [Geminicoccus sp.]HEX2529596.1 ABC transporter substrate-binding protein [Geminicoccus sp.]
MAAAMPLAVQAAEMQAEVLHWWTSGGESAAVQVFAEKFKENRGAWVDTAIAGGTNARTAGINRIVGGNPPTAMQFNTGKQFDELVSNELLADLDEVAAAQNWRDVLPPALIEAVTREDKFYAIPVNIHGINWLWYNKKVLTEAGIQEPATWPDVVAAGEKLEAAGVVGLAQGGQPWQERTLFNSVLVGHGGTDLYYKIYRDGDQAAVDSPKFREVADLFKKLQGLTDEGSPGRNWNDATAMVITGKAGMQVMGDWAKGEFTAAGLKPDVDYGCTVVGEGGYLMGGDVFVFPVSEDETVKATQVKLAEVMFAPETQIAFNTIKGSVPSRLDVDVSGMDICAQKGAAALKDESRQVPTTDFLISPDLSGAIDDVVTQFWNNAGMTTDEFVQKFVGAMQAAG